MTKEKWRDIVVQEMDILDNRGLKLSDDGDPSEWPTVRAALIKFINNVDKVTQIYSAEKERE